MRARTVTLKLRSADFKRHTRSQTLSKAVRSSDILYRTALDLLRAFSISQPIRLIGLGAGNLQPAACRCSRICLATARIISIAGGNRWTALWMPLPSATGAPQSCAGPWRRIRTRIDGIVRPCANNTQIRHNGLDATFPIFHSGTLVFRPIDRSKQQKIPLSKNHNQGPHAIQQHP